MATLDSDENLKTLMCTNNFGEKVISYFNTNPKLTPLPWYEVEMQKVIKYIQSNYKWHEIEKRELVEAAKNLTIISRNNKTVLLTKDNKEIVPFEKLFKVLSEIHNKTFNERHVDGFRMETVVARKYLIPLVIIDMFLNSCTVCVKTYNLPTNPPVYEENRVMNRVAIETFNYEDVIDNEHQYLLIYVDAVSDYTILKPLKTLNNKEIAMELLLIFCDHGPPRSIYSSLNLIDVSNILGEACPEFKVPVYKNVNCIDKINYVKLLDDWMMANNTTHWSIGCNFVQWQLNTTEKNGTSPYKILYETPPGKI